jgi:hypothetical protein
MGKNSDKKDIRQIVRIQGIPSRAFKKCYVKLCIPLKTFSSCSYDVDQRQPHAAYIKNYQAYGILSFQRPIKINPIV